jgi:hypothetical protein
MRESTA